MKRLRIILAAIAITLGIGGALAFERPDLITLKRGCTQGQYPYCLSGIQYVMGPGGELMLAPQGGEGQSWVCMYNPSYICTYSYVYCAEWGEMRFIPCKKGNFCWFTPTYGCEPFPPSLEGANTGVLATPEPDGTIRPTDEQRVIIEAQIAERKKRP